MFSPLAILSTLCKLALSHISYCRGAGAKLGVIIISGHFAFFFIFILYILLATLLWSLLEGYDLYSFLNILKYVLVGH